VHDADKPARNRKRLEENSLAPWELRVGDFRIFYDIHLDDGCVLIVAVGKKIRSTLWIGDEEIKL